MSDNEYAIVKLPESVVMDFTTVKAEAEHYWANMDNPSEWLKDSAFRINPAYLHHYVAHQTEMVKGIWTEGETVTIKVDACQQDGCMDWLAGVHEVQIAKVGDYDSLMDIINEPITDAWQLSMYI
jgi:hypothetical protein